MAITKMRNKTAQLFTNGLNVLVTNISCLWLIQYLNSAQNVHQLQSVTKWYDCHNINWAWGKSFHMINETVSA